MCPFVFQIVSLILLGNVVICDEGTQITPSKHTNGTTPHRVGANENNSNNFSVDITGNPVYRTPYQNTRYHMPTPSTSGQPIQTRVESIPIPKPRLEQSIPDESPNTTISQTKLLLLDLNYRESTPGVIIYDREGTNTHIFSAHDTYYIKMVVKGYDLVWEAKSNKYPIGVIYDESTEPRPTLELVYPKISSAIPSPIPRPKPILINQVQLKRQPKYSWHRPTIAPHPKPPPQPPLLRPPHIPTHPSTTLIDLDLAHQGPTQGYSVTIDGPKTIFTATSPYLFGKVLFGGSPLWEFNNNGYPNKVVYKIVDGENNVEVFFPSVETRVSSATTPGLSTVPPVTTTHVDSTKQVKSTPVEPGPKTQTSVTTTGPVLDNQRGQVPTGVTTPSLSDQGRAGHTLTTPVKPESVFKPVKQASAEQVTTPKASLSTGPTKVDEKLTAPTKPIQAGQSEFMSDTEAEPKARDVDFNEFVDQNDDVDESLDRSDRSSSRTPVVLFLNKTNSKKKFAFNERENISIWITKMGYAFSAVKIKSGTWSKHETIIWESSGNKDYANKVVVYGQVYESSFIKLFLFSGKTKFLIKDPMDVWNEYDPKKRIPVTLDLSAGRPFYLTYRSFDHLPSFYHYGSRHPCIITAVGSKESGKFVRLWEAQNNNFAKVVVSGCNGSGTPLRFTVVLINGNFIHFLKIKKEWNLISNKIHLDLDVKFCFEYYSSREGELEIFEPGFDFVFTSVKLGRFNIEWTACDSSEYSKKVEFHPRKKYFRVYPQNDVTRVLTKTDPLCCIHN